jgi:hypothetical protein
MLPGSNIQIDVENKQARSEFMQGSNILLVPADIDQVIANLEKGFNARPQINTTYLSYIKYSNEIDTVFDTILFPIQPNTNVQIRVQRFENMDIKNGSSLILHLNKDGNSYRDYYLSRRVKQDIGYLQALGKYHTDSKMLHVREDQKGNIISIHVLSGKKIFRESNIILECDRELEDITILWDTKRINIFISGLPLIEYHYLKVYSHSPGVVVHINGIEVNCLSVPDMQLIHIMGE